MIKLFSPSLTTIFPQVGRIERRQKNQEPTKAFAEAEADSSDGVFSPAQMVFDRDSLRLFRAMDLAG